ncbi:MAG: Acg family FMN-binding oxidoreductase, partial [Bacteroidota bacterium]
SEVSSLIETGRRVERMLLRIRERGIAMHPMSQVLEENPYAQQLTNVLELDKPLQFVIRAGYVEDYPHPVSLRKDLEDILL